MLNALIQPDGADAWDFLWNLRRTDWNMPEESLMAAVLEDAICAYRHGASILGSLSQAETRRRKEIQAREAKQWFMDSERDYPFAFISVCEALKIEPDYLRLMILKLGPVK